MRFQEAIGRTVMVENPSTYLRHVQSDRAEPQFLAELCQRSGCGLLLDVNNVFVSTENHGDDAQAYLAAIAHLPIGEIHLSGHHLRQIGNRSIRIDDHGSPVSDPVWALYEHALAVIGPRPTLIEWDSAVPPLEILLAEAGKAQARLDAGPSGARHETGRAASRLSRLSHQRRQRAAGAGDRRGFVRRPGTARASIATIS